MAANVARRAVKVLRPRIHCRRARRRAGAALLAAPFGTIRRAMEVLRDRSLITTIHGRGTFVAKT